MSPKTLQTLLVWISMKGVVINTPSYFQIAHFWAFSENDNLRVKYCFITYMQSGLIPEFVKEFTRDHVYPQLLLKGDGNEIPQADFLGNRYLHSVNPLQAGN